MAETAQDVLDERRRRGAMLRAQFLPQDARRRGPVSEACAVGEDAFCWGTIWSRPLISLRTRAVLALAMSAGVGQLDGVRENTRIALETGWSPAELAEIMLHVQCYGGLYAARAAASAADDVIAEFAPRVSGEQRARSESGPQGQVGEHEQHYAINPLARLGLRIRRDVLGHKDVDAWMDDVADDAFMLMFADITHEYCFGTVWGRPLLDYSLRSMLSLAVSAARGQTGAIRRHTRSAIEAGLSKAEIGELFLHAYVYGGVYCALNGFTTAREIFSDLSREGITVADRPPSDAPPL